MQRDVLSGFVSILFLLETNSTDMILVFLLSSLSLVKILTCFQCFSLEVMVRNFSFRTLKNASA